MCPIQYGCFKEYLKTNVLKTIAYLHCHNYNSSNVIQVTTTENEIIKELWIATLFHIIIIIDDNDSHHGTLVKMEGCAFKKVWWK